MFAPIITPPDLRNDEEHIGTDLAVYTAEGDLMQDWSLRLANNDSILQPILDIELTKGETYMVRGRFVFEPGGLQGWSGNITFVADDTNDIRMLFTAPENYYPPTFRDSKYMYPPGEFKTPQLDFTEISGNVRQTTWFIETMGGKPAWFKETVDDTESTIVDTSLEPNTSYLLKAAVMIENNATTLLTTVPFVTGAFEIGDFKVVEVIGCSADQAGGALPYNLPASLGRTVGNQTVGIPRAVIVQMPPNTDHLVTDVYNYGDNELIKTIESQEVIDLFYIDSNAYYLEIKAILVDGTEVGPIYHYIYKRDRSGLPYCLPAKLGT